MKLLLKIVENENILRKSCGLYRKKLIDKNDKNNCKEGITSSSLQLLDFLSEKKMDFENNVFQKWLTDSTESAKNS